LKTFREDYIDRFGLDLPRVLHVIEYLQPFIEASKLKLKKSNEIIKVTWHDPCHLGRALGIYEEPREILRAIPGVELIEMETNRKAAMCCGSGGGLRSYDAEQAKKIAASRMQDAENVKADILATACPFCEHNLKDGASQIGSKVKIVDILDLIAQQLE